MSTRPCIVLWIRLRSHDRRCFLPWPLLGLSIPTWLGYSKFVPWVFIEVFAYSSVNDVLPSILPCLPHLLPLPYLGIFPLFAFPSLGLLLAFWADSFPLARVFFFLISFGRLLGMGLSTTPVLTWSLDYYSLGFRLHSFHVAGPLVLLQSSSYGSSPPVSMSVSTRTALPSLACFNVLMVTWSVHASGVVEASGFL